MASTCRSCQAPILWVRTERGAKMPLDPEPAERATNPTARGLFVLRDTKSAEGPLAIAITPRTFEDEQAYTSHFATCPHAAQWRQ